MYGVIKCVEEPRGVGHLLAGKHFKDVQLSIRSEALALGVG